MKGLHLNVMCVCVIVVAVLIAYHVGTRRECMMEQRWAGGVSPEERDSVFTLNTTPGKDATPGYGWSKNTFDLTASLKAAEEAGEKVPYCANIDEYLGGGGLRELRACQTGVSPKCDGIMPLDGSPACVKQWLRMGTNPEYTNTIQAEYAARRAVSAAELPPTRECEKNLSTITLACQKASLDSPDTIKKCIEDGGKDVEGDIDKHERCAQTYYVRRDTINRYNQVAAAAGKHLKQQTPEVMYKFMTDGVIPPGVAETWGSCYKPAGGWGPGQGITNAQCKSYLEKTSCNAKSGCNWLPGAILG